ncbi:hypothetical protein HO757_06285 [Streptococcus suis]|uniref:Abortive infection bacteriophage resistance protein n=1 Tax=Streptococcus suis TaxID=1307 RepID=A0A116QR26_STRSU|nr:Abi family protein [Streptococcus suis]NQN60495.1 hypothetical protein [Streptococcus suis]NQP75476.1 hypothetical protein [Streptococcus suis]NQP77504.1 hypothetical protein [Streptococcus suis]NQP91845.1 hypothetical protein [Streptococcus suis]NQP93801.1 hypothetical protein [Streptococcus suis]
MGKNTNKKKKGIGSITKLHRNYGYITTNSFGQEDEEIPFEISPGMIKIIDGKEMIEYSKEVNFELKKGVTLRDRIIREAINLQFDKHNIILKERVTSVPYLQQVRDKFDLFNIELPSYQNMKTEMTDDVSMMVKELRGTGMTQSEIEVFQNKINESNEQIYKTDDDILYEYLKFKGFQPYMLEFLVNGVFLDKNILSQVYSISSDNQKHYQISDVVQLSEIDATFREKILKWILGIENAYKSLLSRISTQQLGGDKVAENVVLHWKNSPDRIKQEQYKRATNRYKYLIYSDQYDYIGNPGIFPLDDLMDQMDLTSLESLLTVFDKFAKEKIKYQGQEIKSIFPWVRDIVLHKEILRDLRLIRNAAAHGRPIIPAIMNPDYNPNWDLEFDNPEGRTKIKSWVLFSPVNLVTQNMFEVNEAEATKLMNTIFGNPYRKAWFELNFIYRRFIAMFDPKRYNDFSSEKTDFLNYEVEDGRTDSEKKLNPRLYNMGDTVMFEKTKTPPPFRVISNEAFMAENVADIHCQNMAENIGKYF